MFSTPRTISYAGLTRICTTVVVCLLLFLVYNPPVDFLDECYINRFENRTHSKPHNAVPQSPSDNPLIPLPDSTTESSSLPPTETSSSKLPPKKSAYKSLLIEPKQLKRFQLVALLVAISSTTFLRNLFEYLFSPEIYSIKPNYRTKKNENERIEAWYSLSSCVVRFLSVYLWFLGGHWLVGVLKVVLNDQRCNIHHNSVSGHALLYVYSSLALFHLHVLHVHPHGDMDVRSAQFWRPILSPNHLNTLIFLTSYVCHVFFSSISLLSTYVFGFHSGRQLIYGALVALILHLLIVEMYELVQLSRDGESEEGWLRRISTSPIQQTLVHLFQDEILRPKKLRKFPFYPLVVTATWNLFTFVLTLITYIIGAETHYTRYLCQPVDIIVCVVCWGLLYLIVNSKQLKSFIFGNTKEENIRNQAKKIV